MLRSLLVLTGILLSNAAHAVCTIDRLRPYPWSTLTSQPTFMFVGSSDCASVEVRFRGLIVKTATMGARAGMDSHWWSVTLTPAEWRRVTAPKYIFLWWTVAGTTASGDPPGYERGANELDLDADGWTRWDGDLGTCDNDASVNPGQAEICGNGVDDDCNGEVDGC